MKKIIFGLIGKNIGYSKSKEFFEKKFKKYSILNMHYDIFDIPNINNVPIILNNPFLKGCNITIPYKKKNNSFFK